FVGSWGKFIGFLRREHTRVLVAFSAALTLVFFAAIFYLRQPEISGSPQIYFYLEVGGTLLSFCYAANALVRFRGTHDRTALILAFGFVLSGIIETVGYFGLDNLLASGSGALSRPWDLLPGALFLMAAIFFRERLKDTKRGKGPAGVYDYALFAVASLNVICHMSAAFSRQLFDGPFFLAELSKIASYIIMLS